MAIRRDVWRLAEQLSAKSRINIDHVYWWLMETGKMHSKNPTRMRFSAGLGRVICVDDSNSYLQVFDAGETVRSNAYDGPDYEDFILARQEAWMD